MHRRLAHAGHLSLCGHRRRFHFTNPRPIVAGIASLHRWRRQILKVWSPVDAFAGLVFVGMLAGSCWVWYKSFDWLAVTLL